MTTTTTESTREEDDHHDDDHEPTHHHQFHTQSLRGDGYGGGGWLLQSVKDNGIQSHNYEPDESEVWRAYVAQVHFQNRGHWWTTGKKRSLKRWVLTFAIGVVQAIVATSSNFVCKALARKKFEHVYRILRDSTPSLTTTTTQSTDFFFGGEEDDAFAKQTTGATHHSYSHAGPSPGASIWHAFWVFCAYQVLYAAVASLFVWIEPVSGGSGVAEIKCFLNGIDLPRIVRMKTLLCKVCGVTFSVAAGLPVGMEGPMVHCGAIVAASVSQGKTSWGAVDTSFSKFSDFRNDREKRDFVACGTAAGICSAFGSPIGGVLFSLEEATSFFTTKLTWYVFARWVGGRGKRGCLVCLARSHSHGVVVFAAYNVNPSFFFFSFLFFFFLSIPGDCFDIDPPTFLPFLPVMRTGEHFFVP